MGFGISLGKEWYTDTWMIWGVTLTYTRDSFKSQQKFVAGITSPQAGGVAIPGTPSSQPPLEVSSYEELEYIGITFSLTYD